MSRLEYYINMNEASYPGNMGIMEITKFYKVASRKEQDEMDEVLENEDWERFKELIAKVLKVRLI